MKENKNKTHQIIRVKNAGSNIDSNAEIIRNNSIKYLPKVSVIIPIYNTEKYLKECLDSIINQTLKEIEIICINDGSTDKSLDIANEFAQIDTRITLITQKKAGAGSARNAGLDIAKGEYIYFCDSDDFVELTMLEKLYNKAISQNADITACKANFWEIDNTYKGYYMSLQEHLLPQNKTFSIKDDPDIFDKITLAIWIKLYKRTFLIENNIRFQNIPCCNDIYFSRLTFFLASKINIVPETLYHYRQNIPTNTSSTRGKHFECALDAAKLIENRLKKENLFEKYKKQYNKFTAKTLLWEYQRCEENSKKEFLNKIEDFLPTEEFINYFSSQVSLPINIAYAFNKKFHSLSLTSITSVIENTQNEQINFIIMYEEIDSNVQNILQQLIKDTKHTITYLQINSKIFNEFPLASWLSKEAWFRCLLPDLMPDIEKVLYLDSDTIIRHSLLPLYYSKMHDKIIAGVEDISQSKSHAQRLKLKDNYYLNSGVLLINCNAWRKNKTFEKIKKYALENKKEIQTSDQDTINKVLDEKKLHLSPKYNYLEVWWRTNKCQYDQIELNDYKEAQKNASIVHFVGPKPIEEHCKNSYLAEFYWYANKIPNFTQIFSDNTIINIKRYSKIPVILSADNNYAPYMYITMFSMLENAKKTTSYDYYLLVPSSFDNKNKKMIMKLKENYNCDIHFIDMKNSFSDLKQMIAHITSPTYYRLLAADILPNYYDRCLYLDVDVCVCQDLSELYSIDLGNNYVAGVKAAGYHFAPQKHCQRLKLPNIDHYINAGVLVMNLKQIRQDKMTEKFVKLSKNNYETVDQDVLNVACFGRIKTLPLKYNFMQQYETLNIWQSCISKKIYSSEEIEEAKNSPVIIHYANKIKPWNDISVYMAEHWWKYADKAHISKINKKIEYKKLLQKWFLKYNKHELNLDYPTTFNEKIQWMKLYASTPIKTVLADKYLVRQWIKDTIGEEYLIPILGVYDKYEDINFDTLPEQFVIKCNHGCGYNIIVKDKNELDKEATKQKLNKWMSENFAFKCGFELHYKNIKPKIIIEKYMEDESGELQDYKFMCFNGKTKLILLDSNRYSGHKRNVYNENWELQNFSDFPNNPHKIAKPSNLEKLKELAHILSKEFNFARIDFYIVNGSIYFGEITFTPASGNLKFPHSIDKELGSLIKLPSKAYDIDTGKYYKLKRISKLRNWLNNKLLKYKTRKDLHKTVLTQLKQYRLDIKNEGGADNKIEISSNKSCRISQPAWFSNAKGIGQVVEGYDKNNLLRIKAIKSGKLILSFKAPDKKIDNKRIPFWIDYKSIKINDQEILNAPISVWHDKPYNYEMNVKNGDVIYITFETQYHQYPKWELQNIIFALNWNNMNVLKKLRKIRKGIAKKIKPKKASKIFCIEQKGCKKTIKLFGFKISFVNKQQELIEQLKQYNRALGKQLERLQNLQESISVQLRNQGNRSNKISEQISKIEKQTDMIKEQLKTISKNTWK